MPLIRKTGTIRVEMEDGDWYDLRESLGHFYRTLLSDASYLTIHLPGRKINRGETLIADDDTIPATMDGMAETQNKRLFVYIKAWSHTDDEGRPVPVTEQNCRDIPHKHALVLLGKIAELEREQDGPAHDSPLGG